MLDGLVAPLSRVLMLMVRLGLPVSYQGTKTEGKRDPTGSKGSSQSGSSDSGAPEKYNHDSTEKTIQTAEKKVEFANIGYPGSRDEGNEHMMASEASWYFI